MCDMYHGEILFGCSGPEKAWQGHCTKRREGVTALAVANAGFWIEADGVVAEYQPIMQPMQPIFKGIPCMYPWEAAKEGRKERGREGREGREGGKRKKGMQFQVSLQAQVWLGGHLGVIRGSFSGHLGTSKAQEMGVRGTGEDGCSEEEPSRGV